MKRMTLVLLAALSLSGFKEELGELGAKFEKLAPDIKPMTIVIRPNYPLMVGGGPASVVGTDTCPALEPSFRLSFGSDFEDRDEGKKRCIIITPETASVSVTAWFPDGPSNEVWSVERSPGRTVLRRADGRLIGAPPSNERSGS